MDWALTQSLLVLNTDAATFRVFERKVLRKIFDPVRVGNDFHIQANNDLYKLLNAMDVMHYCWLGNVIRIEENAPT